VTGHFFLIICKIYKSFLNANYPFFLLKTNKQWFKESLCP